MNLPVVSLVHDMSQHRLAHNHLAEVLTCLPGKRLVLTNSCYSPNTFSKTPSYLSSVGISGLASCESRGVDVGECERHLRRRAVPGRAADDDGPAVHHLLHDAFLVLLGSSSGGGGGGYSLCLVLLGGHGGHSMFHTGFQI